VANRIDGYDLVKPVIQGTGRIRNRPGLTTGPADDFQSLLADQLALGGLRFSGHARKRLAVEGSRLNRESLEKLSAAVEKVRRKGGRESLILMRDMAFVVSVKNRTVITAVGGERMKENVFTNIDSAVIVDR